MEEQRAKKKPTKSHWPKAFTDEKFLDTLYHDEKILDVSRYDQRGCGTRTSYVIVRWGHEDKRFFRISAKLAQDLTEAHFEPVLEVCYRENILTPPK